MYIQAQIFTCSGDSKEKKRFITSPFPRRVRITTIPALVPKFFEKPCKRRKVRLTRSLLSIGSDRNALISLRNVGY